MWKHAHKRRLLLATGSRFSIYIYIYIYLPVKKKVVLKYNNASVLLSSVTPKSSQRTIFHITIESSVIYLIFSGTHKRIGECISKYFITCKFVPQGGLHALSQCNCHLTRQILENVFLITVVAGEKTKPLEEIWVEKILRFKEELHTSENVSADETLPPVTKLLVNTFRG